MPEPIKEIIFECVTGSRSRNLHIETSDKDTRGVFLAPLSAYWNIEPVPQHHKKEETDSSYNEVRRWAFLVAKPSPEEHELFWGRDEDIILNTYPYAWLRERRETLLSKDLVGHYLYAAYGLLIGGLKKVRSDYIHPDPEKEAKRFAVGWKELADAIRRYKVVTSILKDGHLPVWFEGESRAMLMAIRNEEVSSNDIEGAGLEADQMLRGMLESSTLPQSSNPAILNMFLLEAMQYAYDLDILIHQAGR